MWTVFAGNYVITKQMEWSILRQYMFAWPISFKSFQQFKLHGSKIFNY